MSIGEIRSSLARMQDIADEAYLQVRETLSNLHSSAKIDLEKSLRDHAEKVAQRADFQVEITCSGNAAPLHPHIKRQILYICREALHNVEKHANARLVKIDLVWAPGDLCLTIRDDGSGFVSSFDNNNGSQLGVTIMYERANDINAELTFDSQVGKGTGVSLKVPLTATPFRAANEHRN